MRFLSKTKTNSSTVVVVSSAPPPESVALESDFVVILAAFLCALICVVGLIAVVRCTWLRRGSTGDSYFRSSSANKGLKKKVLQSLPKFEFRTSIDSKLSSEQCAICLGDFANGDQIRVLPQCGHVFHLACIDTWLGSHSSCPSCRQILNSERCQKCGQFSAMSGHSSGALSSPAITNSILGFLP